MDNKEETLPTSAQEDITFPSEDAEVNIKDSDAKKKIPYPKHIFFILGNEVCERYSFYGMKAILTIYMIDKLKYTKEEAFSLLHTFVTLAYFMPLFGSIISDQFVGKFNTIVSLSIVYVVGHIIKTVGSVTSYDTIPHEELCILGLVIIAIGTGGIKPCVAAFAGDQFVLPEQDRQVQSFFSIFYMSINLGSLVSMIVGPALYKMPCLGEDDCYPLAFGVPAVLMIIATVIIVMGKPFYTIRPSDGIVTKSICVIWEGLTSTKKSKSQHWLDPAKEKYGEDLVNDIKFLLGCNGILILFLPMTAFWAVFDQGGSRWVTQAKDMDGTLGAVTILPDQMQFINPLFILILVPIFDRLIYPCLAKWNILVKPLQRMTVGLYLAAVAFGVSGILELFIQSNPVGSLHMFCQIPQIFLITVAEILLSITGLEFAYKQAPSSMKSIIQAFWLLTVAGGNLLNVLQSLIVKIEDRALAIFLFAGVTVVSAIIFTFLAWKFVPRKAKAEDMEEDKETEQEDMSEQIQVIQN